MAKEKMHVATAMDIRERLERAIAILERENTPEEYRKAIEELKSIAEDLKVSYAEKPIPKKAWDNLWSDLLADFIMDFEHNAVIPVEDEEENDRYEAFLRGMAKGMWTLYNMIESLMVREE
jgi:hypothetical protein